MLGAIIGDIVGSRFEFDNHRSKDFELFAEGCFATDDSIMTLSVAKAIMETQREAADASAADAAGLSDAADAEAAFYPRLRANAVYWMRSIGQHYPDCGYGGRFYWWMFITDNPAPYDSFGNGAAMRVSPAGFAARSMEEAVALAKAVTEVTHNHPEGVKGAETTAVAVYMARTGCTQQEIAAHIVEHYYALDFTIDGIREDYIFNETCQHTVPQAIECFLESCSFEDAIRTAISLGGDSDTIAAIAGAIAEAYYGIPGAIRTQALSYLDDRLRPIYDEWEARYGMGQELH